MSLGDLLAMEKMKAELARTLKAAGFNPEAYKMYAYAALQSIAGAAKAAGSNDPEGVAKAMEEEGAFQMVLGDISFDEKGDPTLPGYIMHEWKKGPGGKYSYFPQSAKYGRLSADPVSRVCLGSTTG
ncbi:ABC-type branched-subunit amino acid transport system substrate-binding protein [Rhizobium sp. BK399]|nr:ABC-type branched-subunit amino acid transport system substrate-binding protein [Rhizobium sp. BK399]